MAATFPGRKSNCSSSIGMVTTAPSQSLVGPVVLNIGK